jgi:hypothetical protein
MAVLALSSCSGKAKVSGQITFNGKPLPAGRITFVGANGKASDPVDIINGTYEVLNAPIGECKIKVETAYLLNMMGPMSGISGMPGGGMGMPDMSKFGNKMPEDKKGDMAKNVTAEMIDMKDKLGEYVVIIPNEYANPEKTTLTFHVKSGTNVHNVELTGPEQQLPKPKK